MRKTLLGLFALSIIACSKPEKPAQWVNPLIGTGGHGHTYPGVAAPFGFMQLSPDTRLEGWDGCGGYHYSDSIIYGFSHTHLSGTGISDYGDLLIMPFTGKGSFNNGAKLGLEQGYGSRFSHANEEAHAGYYRVKLDDYQIEVELSALAHSGMHNYRYPSSPKKGLIIDLEHRDELLDYSLKQVDSVSFSGHRISKAWAQEQHFYFYFQLSQPPYEVEYNTDSTKLKLFVDPSELQVKVGSSAVSAEGARKNLEAEMPAWDFSALRQESESLWNKELGAISAEFNSEEERSIFYTALYHSYLNPNVFADVDGQYRGTDLKIHQAKDFTPHTVFSLWDTYRATHPLFTITQRRRTVDFIRTFLDQYEKGGQLPMWELCGNYTGCMIGYHSVPVIVDAYAKGIRDFDAPLALEAMLRTANADELGKPFWRNQGYMASNEEHESVSKNLEYAYNDWCIAQFAKAQGDSLNYRKFMASAQQYQNSFDPESGFMRAKRNQMFVEPFNPSEVNFNFTEANSWQYSFYVPHDVSGLISLHGGPEALEAKLDALFEAEEETAGRHQADITGLIGQYAHGNEPSHHMAYLYNYVKASHKTQAMVRRILKEMYSNQPDGLIGNEDCGQMSSWYVLSALGFYPVSPGSTQYAIGSPSVLEAEIRLENGKTFKVSCKNQSPENVYIQKIRLNGGFYAKSWIEHDMILSGGHLEFEMGPRPGVILEAAKSEITEELVSPVPYLKMEQVEFRDSLVLQLLCADPSARILYKTPEAPMFMEHTGLPLILTEDIKLELYAKSPGKKPSPHAYAEVYRLRTNRKLSYSVPYDPQYSAGGPSALLDGFKGGDEFRTGAWQGWQGQSPVLEIDLGAEGETLSRLSSSHIQDTKSWIFMPRAVRYYYADANGEKQFLGEVKAQTRDSIGGVRLEEFVLEFPERKTTKIWVEYEAYGPLPEWHISAGEASWLFIDEVHID